MSNTILIKRSGTANAVPASGNLALGELAINYTDGNLFYKDGGGTVQTIASKQFVSVSGNITGANVNTGQLSLSGNVISVINSTSNITTTGNIAGNYFLGNGSLLTGIDATSIQNGTSNVRVVSSGGNVAIGVGGTSNVAVFATTGAYITGLISANGNITGGNLNAAGLSLSGNVLSVINSTSNITTTANAAIGNLLTDGLYHANGVAWDFQQPAGSNTQIQYNDGSGGFGASANFTFNDSTQLLSVNGTQSVTGNITSGNLNAAGLSLSSNVVSALNSTSNITTTANIAGAFFIGNGSQLTGVTASSVDANNLTGNTLNSGVIFSSLTTVGTLTSLSVSGNVTGGNVLTGGLISSTGTITSAANVAGGNITTGGQISATGNITGGNISTSGSGGNISGANVISGTTLSATANVIGGNITTGGEVSAIGNITGGNLNTTGQLSTSGNLSANNVSVTNSLTAGVISSAGTITGTTITGSTLSSTGNVNTVGIVGTGNISTTGNISGGNLLTGSLSLSANVISAINTTSNITTTANVSGGNVLASRVSASGNVDGANVNVGTKLYTANIVAKTNSLTFESLSNGNINIFPNGTGNIVLANTIINNLAEPLQNQDAATKYYVDNAVTTGFTFHQPVFASTNTDLATATGGTITYTQPNGVANGIGATLTTTGSFNLIDTANIQTIGTRVLVKDQANAVQNGIYVWANATAIVRSTDADEYGSASTEQFGLNDYFFTQSGNVNAGTAYIVSAPAGTITFGTSNITFAEFSSTQVYSANNQAGISLNGTVINAKVDNTTTAFDGGGNIVVKVSAQLTTPNIGAATGDSLSVTGLITGGNITAGSGYVSTTGNVIGGNITTGGLITATGNIASSANVSGGNILTGGLISATATITGGNLATGGTASAAGNVTGGNVLTGGLISAAATITGGNLATGGTASAGGNITGANLITGGLVTAVGNVIGGNITTAGQLISTQTGNSADGAGQLYLNGSGNNRIDWAAVGTGAPAFTTRSAGTKVVLYPSLSGSSVDYAIGVDAATLWSSVPEADPSFKFKWYGATTEVANLSGTGSFAVAGNITTTANIAGGNILGGSGIITTSGNITGGNILFGSGIVSGTGNIYGGNIFQGANQVLDTASTVDGGLY